MSFTEFMARVKFAIRIRQYDALRTVNREMVGLYWDLGAAIARKEEETGWGPAFVDSLARAVQAEFPGSRGFSAANLRSMRKVYSEYRDKPALQALMREVGWSKNLVVLRLCRADAEREFYLKAASRFGWSRAELENRILGRAWERAQMDPAGSGAAWLERTALFSLDIKVAEALQDEYTCDLLNPTGTDPVGSGE
jgi:predicted nuclease of restriction endonuclease-like (RecB) superfamily